MASMKMFSGLSGIFSTQAASRAAFMGGEALSWMERTAMTSSPMMHGFGVMGRRMYTGAMFGAGAGAVRGFASPGDGRGRVGGAFRGAMFGGMMGGLGGAAWGRWGGSSSSRGFAYARRAGGMGRNIMNASTGG
ncbi:MAG TPA: hypothetical protein VEP90_03600, partial [Methylomirabilota bacterium]|nr:hypothetical protein [Methylomirabilota bacterium]